MLSREDVMEIVALYRRGWSISSQVPGRGVTRRHDRRLLRPR